LQLVKHNYKSLPEYGTFTVHARYGGTKEFLAEVCTLSFRIWYMGVFLKCPAMRKLPLSSHIFLLVTVMDGITGSSRVPCHLAGDVVAN